MMDVLLYLMILLCISLMTKEFSICLFYVYWPLFFIYKDLIKSF